MASSGKREKWRDARAAHPPEPLHGVGLTYVDRGSAYWWRRAGLTLFWFFLTALSGVMAVGVTLGVGEAGPTLLIVTSSLYAALSLGVGWTTALAIRSADRFGVGSGSFEESRWGVFMGKLDERLAWFAVILVVALPIVFGAMLPLLVRSFGRYTIGERHQRRQLGLDT